MKYGERVKQARKAARLSQLQLSEAAGVSQQTISRIERNEQPPSGATIAIAKVLGTTPEALITGKDKQVNELGAEYRILSPDAVPIIEISDISQFLAGNDITPSGTVYQPPGQPGPLFAIRNTGKAMETAGQLSAPPGYAIVATANKATTQTPKKPLNRKKNQKLFDNTHILVF